MGSRPLSTEQKVGLIQRLKTGVSVSTLARESGVLRKSLYEWQAAYAALGVAGLNRKRGPKPGGRGVWRADGGRRRPADARPPDDLAEAKARIAELERVIGRQQSGARFFSRGLAVMGREAPQQRRDHLFGVVRQMTRRRTARRNPSPGRSRASLPDRRAFARQLLSLAGAQSFVARGRGPARSRYKSWRCSAATRAIGASRKGSGRSASSSTPSAYCV